MAAQNEYVCQKMNLASLLLLATSVPDASPTHHEPNALLIFAFGFVGTAAPEIVRLYRLRYKKLDFSRFYILISLFYGVLGGIIALILPAVNVYAAFYAGISAPVVVSAATNYNETVSNSESNRGNDPIAGSELFYTKKRQRSMIELFRSHSRGLFQ